MASKKGFHCVGKKVRSLKSILLSIALYILTQSLKGNKSALHPDHIPGKHGSCDLY